MTLWGETEQIHVHNTEQLHAHDCHQDVTETSDPKNMTHQTHVNGESAYSSVKQSSRYVTRGLY